MIELKEISKSYGEQLVLNNVNIIFPDKGLFCIVGKSGCGKSTFLNLISGIDDPSGGNIYYNNKSYLQLRENNEFDLYKQQEIGMIFQDYFLMENLSVYDNLRLVCELCQIDESKIEYYLIKFNILSLKKIKIKKLSGGERQRVAIARALLKGFSILIADEPTGNLDYENSQIIYEILKEISKESLVIMATHDITSAKKYSDKIIDFSEINNSNISFLGDKYEPKTLEESKIINKTRFIPLINYSNKIFSSKLRIFSTIIYTLLASFILLSLSLVFTNPGKLMFQQYKYDNLGYDDISSEALNMNYINKKFSSSNVYLGYDCSYNSELSLLLAQHLILSKGNLSDNILKGYSFLIDESLDDNSIRISKNLLSDDLDYTNLTATLELNNYSNTFNVEVFEPIGSYDYRHPFNEHYHNSVFLNLNVFNKINQYKNLTKIIYEDQLSIVKQLTLSLKWTSYKKMTINVGNEFDNYEGGIVEYFGKNADNLSYKEVCLNYEYARDIYGNYSIEEILNRDFVFENDVYKVAGLYNTYSSTDAFPAYIYSQDILVNEESFSELGQLYFDNVSNNSSSGFIQIQFDSKNEKSDIAFLNYVIRHSNNLFNNTDSIARDIAFIYNPMHMLLYYFFGLFALIIAVLFSLLWVNTIFKIKKKQIGILYSLGLGYKKVSLMISISEVPSFLICSILSVGLYSILNDFYASTYASNIYGYYELVNKVDLIPYNLYGLIFVVLLFSLLIIFSIYLYSRKIRNKKNIDILYQRKE